MQLIRDIKHPKMWRIRWRDGTISSDCYNLDRAKEIMYRIENRYKNLERMIGVGETWEFPIMGRNDFRKNLHWCVLRGESYLGSQWVVKTRPWPSNPSLEVFDLEQKVVNS